MMAACEICRVHVCEEALTRRKHRAEDVPCDGRTIERVVLDLVGVRVDAEAAGGVLEHAVVMLNGKTLTHEDAELSRPIAPSDDLHVAPAGPGDGTSFVISLILTLASAVVSSLLAPRIARPAEQPGDTRRLSFGQYSRTAVRGEPKPLVLGEHPKYGPVKVNAVAGDGDNGDQTLKLLYCIAGHQVQQIGTRTGSADSLTPGTGTGKISGIFFNDQPIENYPSCRISVRMGAAGQAPIPGFKDNEVSREVAAGSGGALLANTSGTDRTGGDTAEVVTYTSVDEVDALVLRISFPGGLYSIGSNENGARTEPRRVKLRWRVRAYPGGSFGGWTDWSVERGERAALTIAPRLDHLPGVGNPPERFEVQVQRVSPDSADPSVADVMRLVEVIEVQYVVNRYVDCAMLAITLTASEQLTSEPKVSVKVKGYNQLRLWDGISDPSTPTFATGYSNDPADLALAIWSDPKIGLGLTTADYPSLLEARTYNLERVPAPSRGASATRPRFVCNLAVISETSALDVLRTICDAMNAVAVVGDRMRIIQQRPRAAPVEIFTDASLARDEKELSAALNYTHTRDGLQTKNQLRAQFANDLLGGNTDLQVYPEAGELWLGGDSPEPTLAETVKYEGITDPDQLMAKLVFEMTKTRALDKALVFKSVSPFVQCQPYERIDVACSLAGWGVASGRLMRGSTAAALTLDRALEIQEGFEYAILVRMADGSVEVSPLGLAPGVYATGVAVPLDVPLSEAPDWEQCEYSIGQAGSGIAGGVVPMVVGSMRRVESGGGDGAGAGSGGWEITAVPYDERIYSTAPGDVIIASHTTLGGERSAPGPVVGLVLHERTLVTGLYAIDLAWTQTPADRMHTAGFMIWRRLVGLETWQQVPGLAPGLNGVDLGVVGPDAGYEFRVVAYSALGSRLSVYDERHPTVALRLGLSALPPPPPSGLTLTQVSGNQYELAWDAADGAASYQVLGGGDAGTRKPNDGAEDCLVVGGNGHRVIGTSMLVELAAGVSVTFWVRSASAAGRLSWTAAVVTEAAPAAPSGEAVKHTFTPDLSVDGTLTNAAWDGADMRVEITDPTDAGGGVIELGPVDTGANTLTTICLRPATSNNAEDPDIGDVLFGVPSIEADQWGVVSGSGDTAAVGMVMPPYSDDQQAWVFEVATSEDGSMYTDFEPLAFGAEIQRVFQHYKLRIPMGRKGGGLERPYSPALRGITVVCTN